MVGLSVDSLAVLVSSLLVVVGASVVAFDVLGGSTVVGKNVVSEEVVVLRDSVVVSNSDEVNISVVVGNCVVDGGMVVVSVKSVEQGKHSKYTDHCRCQIQHD